MFDLEKFKERGTYIHTPTRGVYDKVMKYLDENGFIWSSNEGILDCDVWDEYCSETFISCYYYPKIVYGRLDVSTAANWEKIELKGDDIMNEKIKRDLITLLFEKEFYSHEIDRMREYKGRIIFDYFHKGAKFIDFIEMINENYNIKGHEVAEIIIEECDISAYTK